MTAADHRALIARFYDALGRRDAAAMAACYAPRRARAAPYNPVEGPLAQLVRAEDS